MALNWFKKNKNDKQDPSLDSKTLEEKQNTVPLVPNDETGPKPEPSPDIADEVKKEQAALDADAQTADETALVDSEADTAKKKKKTGLFARLKSGLSKTRKILTTDIDELFLGKRVVDDEMLEDLEELLITSDIGVRTTMDLMDKINMKKSKISNAKALKETLKEEILTYFEEIPENIEKIRSKPHIVMVVGVNGVGKTTTIGKLAAREAEKGQKVLIAAADTFRAAAVEQLAIWAERAGADIVRHKDNADPAAVAYDGVEAAVSRGADIVFVDTAGRLHTKVNLMEELKKIKRAMGKTIADAPHEILLVLDATTGQNALSQAKMFNEAMDLTGLALTKLDGTAKGGIVVSICNALNIPLQYIGVGEGVDDLQEFDSRRFIDAMF